MVLGPGWWRKLSGTLTPPTGSHRLKYPFCRHSKSENLGCKCHSDPVSTTTSPTDEGPFVDAMERRATGILRRWDVTLTARFWRDNVVEPGVVLSDSVDPEGSRPSRYNYGDSSSKIPFGDGYTYLVYTFRVSIGLAGYGTDTLTYYRSIVVTVYYGGTGPL